MKNNSNPNNKDVVFFFVIYFLIYLLTWIWIIYNWH